MTRRTLISLLAAFAVTASWAGVRGPDQAGYAITDASSYSFVDIAATGVRVLANTDDDAAQVGVGFPFKFYGQTYTTACVSTNGLLSFGGCNVDFVNQDLTAASPFGDLPTVAVYWSDLTFAAPGADAVYYQTLGAAPLRQFIVQWNNAFALGGNRAVTFQAVLSEQTNQIRFFYRHLNEGEGLRGNYGGLATVGVRDTNGQSSDREVQWSYQSPVLADGTALLVTPAVAALAGAVNAASFAVGPIAPNTIVSLFGSNLGCGTGLSVLVNSTPASVLYSGPGQVNFVVGANVADQGPAVVAANCSGAPAGRLTVEVLDTAPALFTASQTGQGQAAILNQDYSVNGLVPAERGSVVMVFGTGFGKAQSPGADGFSRLASPVTATIGGIPAEVVYAGLAPGMTVGLQQINVRIPMDSPVGAAVPIEIRAGARTTQPGTTLAVR